MRACGRRRAYDPFVGSEPLDTSMRIGAAAAALGVSVDTLRRWERDGRVSFERRGNQRYLGSDEVARLLNATTCLKHQAALSVAYGSGLRVAEVSALKVADVDSERMLLRVERGKGGRLSPGMVIAIEPMINAGGPEVVIEDDGWTAVTKDGSLSAHFEHSVAITEEGPYVLSRAS